MLILFLDEKNLLFKKTTKSRYQQKARQNKLTANTTPKTTRNTLMSNWYESEKMAGNVRLVVNIKKTAVRH